MGRQLIASIATFFVMLIAPAAIADEASREDNELQDELARLVKEYELPGMVAALVEKGKVTRIAAAGVRKSGEADAITIDDQMHLGSCTKAMTATLLALLVKDGEFTWDTPLSVLLPALAEDMHESYRQVTPRQLLTHRSGLPANSARMFLADQDDPTNQQRIDLFKKILAKEPKYEPGSQFLYSNLGYMLAGLVAETATGETWETLMSDRLFKPLGMKSAGFGVPGTVGKVDQPWGHKQLPLIGLRGFQADNPPVLGPAGTVHAPLDDWAKFVALHLNHQPNPELLDGETLAYLRRPDDGEDYALGWMSVPRGWAKGNAITHSGSNTMWVAVVWAAPERDIAFLAVTNSGQESAAKACDDAVRFLLESL